MTAVASFVEEDHTSTTSRRLARKETFLKTTHRSARAGQKLFPVAKVALFAVPARDRPTCSVASWFQPDYCRSGGRNDIRACCAEMAAVGIAEQRDTLALRRLFAQLRAHLDSRNQARRIGQVHLFIKVALFIG